MVRDCLATSFPHVVVGILLHAAFLYPSNGSADCVQIKCAVRTCLGDNRPPLHFPKAWANRLGPGERCEILFLSV